MTTLAQDIITTVKDTDGGSRRSDTVRDLLVVFGGRSEIGVELARRLAPGATVVLAARRPDDLGAQIAALEQAGATAVHTEIEAVRDAELRYAQRYRTPRPNPKRVVIEVRIERVLGSSDLLDRGGD